MQPKFILYLAVIIISGCSTMPREEFNNAYNVTFPYPIDDSVTIVIEANSNVAVNITTILEAGDFFVSVPSGEKEPNNMARFKRYGNRFAQLLINLNAFQASEYRGSTTDDYESMYLLLIRFNNTYMGIDGWSVDLDATFILKNNGAIVFEKRYKSSSGISGGCRDCFPNEIAEKKLNIMFFNDLLKWQQGKI